MDFAEVVKRSLYVLSRGVGLPLVGLGSLLMRGSVGRGGGRKKRARRRNCSDDGLFGYLESFRLVRYHIPQTLHGAYYKGWPNCKPFFSEFYWIVFFVAARAVGFAESRVFGYGRRRAMGTGGASGTRAEWHTRGVARGQSGTRGREREHCWTSQQWHAAGLCYATPLGSIGWGPTRTQGSGLS